MFKYMEVIQCDVSEFTSDMKTLLEKHKVDA